MHHFFDNRTDDTLWGHALVARCNAAMAHVLKGIDDRKAARYDDEAHVGADLVGGRCERKVMPLIFEGEKTLIGAWAEGQWWTYEAPRPEWE